MPATGDELPMDWREEFADFRPLGGLSNLAKSEFRLDRAGSDPGWTIPSDVRLTKSRQVRASCAGSPWFECLQARDPEGVADLADVALKYEYEFSTSALGEATEDRRPDTRALIDRFCSACSSGTEDVLALAREFGPLKVCGCHALPVDFCTKSHVWNPEPVLAWRYWARQVLSLLSLLTALKGPRRKPKLAGALHSFIWDNAEMWSAIKDFRATAEASSDDPAELVFAIFFGRYDVSVEELRLLDPELGDLPDNRACLAAVAARLTRWMRYAQVAPRLEIERHTNIFHFELDGHGLFGALAKRLTFVALGKEDWEICHHCHGPVMTMRRSNQKLVFCANCKKIGWPQTYRQRRCRANKPRSANA